MTRKQDKPGSQPISPGQLLSRTRLIQRWRHGSDSFFWREEAAGRLLPVQHEGLLRYRFDDVLRFEGGLPPAGMMAAYGMDLMTERQVATVCDCSPGKILEEARKGRLKARRVGRAWRFVGEEVALWQQNRWTRRARKVNGKSAKTNEKVTDE